MGIVNSEKLLGLSFKDISPLNIYKYFSEGMGILDTFKCKAVGLLRIPSDKTYCTVSSPELQLMLLSNVGATFFNYMNLKYEYWNDYTRFLVGSQVMH